MFVRYLIGICLSIAACSARADVSMTYIYDALGRIAQTTLTAGNSKADVQYVYDETGNRIKVVGLKSAPPSIMPAVSILLFQNNSEK